MVAFDGHAFRPHHTRWGAQGAEHGRVIDGVVGAIHGRGRERGKKKENDRDEGDEPSERRLKAAGR
jgi:hypothetical protein